MERWPAEGIVLSLAQVKNSQWSNMTDVEIIDQAFDGRIIDH